MTDKTHRRCGNSAVVATTGCVSLHFIDILNAVTVTVQTAIAYGYGDHGGLHWSTTDNRAYLDAVQPLSQVLYNRFPRHHNPFYRVESIMLLKSTTRHIRIFSADIANDQLVPSADKLTLDIDPDNEMNWDEAALSAVRQKFDELVDSYDGKDLTDYNLRRIGSDLEHFVRSLLQQGTISYNVNSRVQNYSLGLPRVSADETV